MGEGIPDILDYNDAVFLYRMHSGRLHAEDTQYEYEARNSSHVCVKNNQTQIDAFYE